jgi:sortase A
MKLTRIFEIAFWILGVCLLSAAFAARSERVQYQEQQERALFNGEPAVAAPAAVPFSPAPLPVKQEEKPEATPKAEPKAKPKADPMAIGRLEIPRIGVRAIVKQGDDDRTLARAVGLVPGSPRPGEEGNIILAGHRDTFFWPLQDIETNDRIRLRTPDATYEYRVQSVRVVPPEETSVLQSKGIEELTLVTCYPFTWVGPAPERFVVKATRVN